ncbi:pheromone-processing carboxypeptidase KEX1-like isoform X3 [Xenia sp. Carnegie-2017]|uniref:pheromone-processing carboxypeptidase KEX1-like isoform X3 n=1 Tax=Xenia sp. Carnegie-2017 TaxID=2897299 RepID=UPI001F0372DD|nr:pheromone-processing carboxypeptidase KEX1-like isoform X3 [Xenia sp. Carnegie-2017]
MTFKRKSKRKGRKNVNYTDMSSNCESDDDFEVDFEPQTKKAKHKEKEMNKEKKGERRKDNDVGQNESSHIKINSEGIDDDARDTCDKSSAKVNKIHDNDVESDSNEEKIVNLKNG